MKHELKETIVADWYRNTGAHPRGGVKFYIDYIRVCFQMHKAQIMQEVYEYRQDERKQGNAQQACHSG